MKRQRPESKAVVYEKSKIPYEVSAPNRYWRIKKDLPPQEYWKKRYWRRRITGKGDYAMDYKKRSTGANWGGYLGSKAGEYIGGAAQRAFSAITGFGDYTVKQNVFASGNLPVVTNDPGAGGTVIRFQEYLGDVVTSNLANTFASQEFVINAANENTFPWLSQIAANYEQYELQGMLFQFRSTSANALNSTNTALGSVMMATQYDVMDAPFASKGEMLNYEFSTSCKPSENCMHMIECAPKQTTITQLYTLSGGVPTGADPRLYHIGRFQIATTGFQGSEVNVGELHVTYQVKLLKPKLFASLGLLNDAYIGYFEGLSAYTNALPLGNPAAPLNVPRSNIAVVNNGNSLTLEPTSMRKTYLLVVNWVGDPTGGTNVTYPGITLTNATTVPGSNIYAPLVGVGIVTAACYRFSFTTTGNNLSPVIFFDNAGTLPGCGVGAGGICFIQLTQINPDVV